MPMFMEHVMGIIFTELTFHSQRTLSTFRSAEESNQSEMILNQQPQFSQKKNNLKPEIFILVKISLQSMLEVQQILRQVSCYQNRSAQPLPILSKFYHYDRRALNLFKLSLPSL